MIKSGSKDAKLLTQYSLYYYYFNNIHLYNMHTSL